MTNSSRSIVLIGMMGAGKSSVGRALARRTGLACQDTDDLVTSKAGKMIPEIFAQDGEEHFRNLESETLRNLPQNQDAIIVTGGGVILRPENLARLKELGLVVWLDADESVLFERASRHQKRPLLQTDNPRGAFAVLLRERGPLYEKAADLRVETTHRTHDEVCDIILSEIEERIASS